MKFIDVYFSPKELSNPTTYSPSPRKPANFQADRGNQAFSTHIVDPVPTTREQIEFAHYRRYVAGVLESLLPNGFRGLERDVADSLTTLRFEVPRLFFRDCESRSETSRKSG